LLVYNISLNDVNETPHHLPSLIFLGNEGHAFLQLSNVGLQLINSYGWCLI